MNGKNKNKKLWWCIYKDGHNNSSHLDMPLCRVTLPLFPSRNGICFPAPLIQTGFKTHCDQQNVAQGTPCDAEPRCQVFTASVPPFLECCHHHVKELSLRLRNHTEREAQVTVSIRCQTWVRHLKTIQLARATRQLQPQERPQQDQQTCPVLSITEALRFYPTCKLTS